MFDRCTICGEEIHLMSCIPHVCFGGQSINLSLKYIMDMPRIIQVDTKNTHRGSISIIEKEPFEPKRVFWITNIPKDQTRAGHAHKQLQQFLVMVKGSCIVKSTKPDGRFGWFKLCSPLEGLYVPVLNWLDITEFSDDAILMVLASEIYDEKDYIKRWEEFTTYKV